MKIEEWKERNRPSAHLRECLGLSPAHTHKSRHPYELKGIVVGTCTIDLKTGSIIESTSKGE